MLATFFAKYTCVEMASRKNKHIRMDGKCKFIKNKTLWLLKKYVFGCHPGCVNRRFCMQKLGEVIKIIEY